MSILGCVYYLPHGMKCDFIFLSLSRSQEAVIDLTRPYKYVNMEELVKASDFYGHNGEPESEYNIIC